MGLGIFPEPAGEIASLMSAEGIDPFEAEQIFLGTLRATRGNLPQAVYRLRQGIWDAGAAAAEVVERVRYTLVEPDPNEPPDPPADPADRLWQDALAELQLELTRATFNIWLRDAKLVACEDGVFVIGVTNAYARDWLANRLHPTIVRILTRLAGEQVEVRFAVRREEAAV